jgi:DNA-binding PadR family transcriptional regulator
MGLKPRNRPAFKAVLAKMRRGHIYTADQLSTGSTTGAVWQTLDRMRDLGLVVRVNPGKSGQGVKAIFMLTAKGEKYE